jgi:tyrosyl-tRNA synthetase
LFEDLSWRGLVHQVTDPALPRLLDQEPFTLYIGFDPSADSLHVGHLQQLLLLRRAQRDGHRPIALVGGGTGMIGDPSGKSEERNLLDAGTLAGNRQAITAQVQALVDAPGGETLVVDNAEWLESVPLIDFLRDVGKLFTVNEMIRKESVRSRLEGRDQGLSFTEFTYQLCQAWDFVQLYQRYRCRLQLGGSDQWGNITEGVELVRRMAGGRAFGLTSPLVTKADGSKFGKTETGTVWLSAERTSPYQFFQFWYRAADAEVGPYLRRFTFLDREAIVELEKATAEAPEKRRAQGVLAREVTSLVHGEQAALAAETASRVLFTPEVVTLDAGTLAGALADAPTTEVTDADLQAGVVDALVRAGLAPSRGRARQELAQGGVYVNGRRETADRPLGAADALHGRYILLRRGKATQHVLVRSAAPPAGVADGGGAAGSGSAAAPGAAAPGAAGPGAAGPGSAARPAGPTLAFGSATAADGEELVALVESAYRGQASRAGWTTEADLLDGQRTDAGAVGEILADPASDVITVRRGGTLVACAHLHRRGQAAYFGMFAVSPPAQGGRIGSAVLEEAERRARRWGCRTMEMTVIPQRQDLIGWYERRGYRATGERLPFPYGDERYGIPRRPDLQLAVLAKDLW